MKIAIHNREDSFSDHWIQYCCINNISYKLVNCYDNDIVNQVKDCDALMWHFHQNYPQDIVFAKQLLFSLEQSGLKVFPDSNTMWHFNDKLGQKYLLESINAPSVKSYVFYNKKSALEWAENTSYPKVFKLRAGAGSTNVFLINGKSRAKRMIKRAFGRGFRQYFGYRSFVEKVRKFKNKDVSIVDLFKSMVRIFKQPDFSKVAGKEKGYVYFQDYLPNNNYDIRVVVIGNRAFALIRYNRDDDFRASGSGNFSYDKELIDKEILSISFATNKKLKAQSLAIDFIYNKNNKPQIVEVSYGFPTGDFLEACNGYWDADLKWHEGNYQAEYFIIENLIEDVII